MPLLSSSVILLGLLVAPPRPAGALIDHATPPRVEGGRPTEPGEYESAVALLTRDTLCSGVMVSSNVLLTAAHCVADIGFGRPLTMYYGPTVDGGRRQQAAEWAAHPSYCPDCRNDQLDIGYVVLTLPYELEGDDDRFATPVVTQNEWDDLMHEGQSLQVVGYAAEESGVRTKRVAEVKLTDLTRSGRELHAEPTDGRTRKGDSGGPYLAMNQFGEQRLVGVHSRGDGCESAMIATTPYPVLCWLRDETGVDLLPPNTADCSSLETGGGGCRVAPGGDARFTAFLVVLFVAFRRRHGIGGSGRGAVACSRP